jgi:glycosyltransferase involved in cell wall biosynthesis
VRTVGINAHLLSAGPGYRRAGIHHYIAQVLQHLPEHPDWRYVVFTRHGAAVASRLGLTTAGTRWPTDGRLGRIGWEQIAWPAEAHRRSLDLLHGMAFSLPWRTPCPGVVTVYDLSFLQAPERFPRLQRAYLAAQTAHSCRVARRVVAISEAGRQDLHRLLRVPLDRIDVVAPGVEPRFRPLPPETVAAFRAGQDLPTRFLLHVGTLQPRKNIPALIQAYARLLAESPDSLGDLGLVLVGGQGWMTEEIFRQVVELGLGDRVRFAGYVPDAQLPLWYNAATILAFPSHYEGFGMPIAEALACGIPVVAANTSSIPEVAGEAALYFPPTDVPALASQLRRLLEDPALRTALGARGRKQVETMTWEQAGQAMLRVYQQALGEA